MHADWFTGNISETGAKDLMHVTSLNVLMFK